MRRVNAPGAALSGGEVEQQNNQAENLNEEDVNTADREAEATDDLDETQRLMAAAKAITDEEDRITAPKIAEIAEIKDKLAAEKAKAKAYEETHPSLTPSTFTPAKQGRHAENQRVAKELQEKAAREDAENQRVAKELEDMQKAAEKELEDMQKARQEKAAQEAIKREERAQEHQKQLAFKKQTEDHIAQTKRDRDNRLTPIERAKLNMPPLEKRFQVHLSTGDHHKTIVNLRKVVQRLEEENEGLRAQRDRLTIKAEEKKKTKKQHHEAGGFEGFENPTLQNIIDQQAARKAEDERNKKRMKGNAEDERNKPSLVPITYTPHDELAKARAALKQAKKYKKELISRGEWTSGKTK